MDAKPFESASPPRSGQGTETPNRTQQTKVTARATRADVDVRVSVVAERHDEEEKEAGYGHGV